MDNSYDVTRLEMYQGIDIPPAEGEMSIPIQSAQSMNEGLPLNTLDEPISETIKRDLKAVGNKFKHVLYPVEKKSLLKEWDLWGPLLLCTFMAVILQGIEKADSHDGGPEFAEVFVLVWIGSAVVTLNTKLLGGHISFFQSVCVLGYCLLPPAIALLICEVILMFNQTNLLFTIRFIVTAVGLLWSVFAAMVFLGDSHPPKRKGLAIYPIFLYYFVISWMVLSHTA